MRWAVVAASLVALFLPARAEALHVEVKVGLDGHLRGEWTQLEAHCSLDPGEQPFKGKLILDFSGYAFGGCETPFELQPGRSTTVRLTVPVLMGKAYAVRVEDAQGKRVVEVEPDDYSRVEAKRRLALLVARTGLGAIESKKLKDPPRLARVDAIGLPRDHRALRGVSAVFLPLDGDDAAMRDLYRDPDRVATLRSYVELGGRLILLARPAFPRVWVGTRLETLIPVRDPSLASVSPQDVAFLLGKLREGASSVPVVRTELAPGAAWVHRKGKIGLVAQRSLGRGRVLFVAFDPDSRVLREAELLGPSLAGMATPDKRTSPRRWLRPRRLERVAMRAFAARRLLSPLGFGLLAAAVVLHILVLGPLTFLLGRKKRSPWAALLVPPLLSVLLALVIMLIGAATRERGEVRMLEFCTQAPSGEARATAQLEVGVFAAHDAKFAIDLPKRWFPALQDRGPLAALQFRDAPPVLRFSDGVARSLGPLSVAARGFSQVRFEGDESRLPLTVARAEHGTVQLTSLAEQGKLTGLAALKLDVQGDRFQLLPDLGPGRSFRWNPQRAPRAAFDRKRTIDQDPFLDEGGRLLLTVRLASLIARRYRSYQARPKRMSMFPDVWILHLDPEPQISLSVRRGSVSSAAPKTCRVTLVPLEQP